MTTHDHMSDTGSDNLEQADGVPSLAEALARDGEKLHDQSELQASLTASTWLGAAWLSRETPDADATRELVDQALAATSLPGGWTALFALATIVDADQRNRLSDALADCPPLERPDWARLAYDVPQPASVTQVDDPMGEEQLFLLRYDQPEPHDLAVSVTHAGGTIVRAIEVVQAGQLDTSGVDAIVTTPEPDVALASIALALQLTDRYWPPYDDADFAPLRALLLHRVQGHQGDQPAVMSDDEWDTLVAEFVQDAHADGSQLDAESLEITAGSLLEYGAERLASGALAWTPTDVQHFLLEWTRDDELVDEDEAAELPKLLRVWLRLVARRRDLSREQREALLASVDDAEPAYLDWYATAFTDEPDDLARLFADRAGHDHDDAGPDNAVDGHSGHAHDGPSQPYTHG